MGDHFQRVLGLLRNGAGGTSVGFDPLGEPDDGVTLQGRIKGAVGPASVEAGFDVDGCATVSLKGKACVTIACAKLDEFAKGRPETCFSGKAPEPFQPSDLAKGEEGGGATIKVAGKVCQQKLF